jgi:hypothetical protein
LGVPALDHRFFTGFSLAGHRQLHVHQFLFDWYLRHLGRSDREGFQLSSLQGGHQEGNKLSSFLHREGLIKRKNGDVSFPVQTVPVI